MLLVGLSMIGVAVAMFVLAHPRDGRVVHWLRGDNRQMAYVMTIVVLMLVGLIISLFG